MSRFFRSKSFTSLGSRPPISPSSPSRPALPPRIGTSTTSDAASGSPSTEGNTTDGSFPILTSIQAQWNKGLIQHNDFRLHAALTTFKRLLRILRSPTGDNSSPTTEDYASAGSSPYHTLLPEEIALLYINIALIHAYLGSYYLAASAFEEALVLDEASGIAWFGLGITRFYLKELGASKRAFNKCLACFVAQDMHGVKYQKEELIYNVWPGRSTMFNKSDVVKDNDGSKGPIAAWKVFEGILGSNLPDNQWRLEWVRVDWNWRNVMFERNHVRRGVERPGNWNGMNGIPAGVIFGLDLRARRGLGVTDRLMSDDYELKDLFPDSAYATTANELNSFGASLVKRKWTGIQQKLLRRKSTTNKRARLQKPAPISNPISSPTSSNDQSLFARSNEGTSRTPTQAYFFPQSPGIRHGWLEPSSPTSLHYNDGSPHDNDTDEEEIQHESDRRGSIENQQLSMFPTRQSSLAVPLTRPQRRRSRGLRLSINTVVYRPDRIEEEPLEHENGKPQHRHKKGQNKLIHTAGRTRHDRPQSSDSDISPRDTSRGVRQIESIVPLERVMPPVLTQDIFAVPARRGSRSSQTATDYGHDSFMTDGISTLGSGVYFPHLSDSRRPSHATDISSYAQDSRRSSHATDMTDGISSRGSRDLFPQFSDSRRPSHATDISFNSLQTEDEGDEASCRPSTMITLTPATPLNSNGHNLSVTASSLGDLVDSYHHCSLNTESFDPASLEAICEQANVWESMAVAPLQVHKKERMSVTGRSCLGEWEWEEEYERWQRKVSEPTEEVDGDADVAGEGEDKDKEDDDYSFGEMLKPTVFEGF
ncbi:MAG: hypothetical protein Q9166_007029 [cf. Caloplaca sp. 2 TL-2023]